MPRDLRPNSNFYSIVHRPFYIVHCPLYNGGMDSLDKFSADMQRIIKHDRASNGGRYDGKRAARSIADFFIQANRDKESLASTAADYWLDEYILTSAEMENEPTESHREKLLAIQAFFDGDEENLSALDDHDLEELRDEVNAEAEELDLDDLQKMMGILVGKGIMDSGDSDSDFDDDDDDDFDEEDWK